VEFVVDNSIVVAWCLQDEGNPLVDVMLAQMHQHQAFVPSIWPLEIGNVLAIAERTKRLSKAEFSRILALLETLPIRVEQEGPRRMLDEILTLARTHQLTTYDASYLDLAMRNSLPIASQDKALIRAAHKAGVRVLDSGAFRAA
jgi:predicted nucleic acid-binding protein